MTVVKPNILSKIISLLNMAWGKHNHQKLIKYKNINVCICSSLLQISGAISLLNTWIVAFSLLK